MDGKVLKIKEGFAVELSRTGRDVVLHFELADDATAEQFEKGLRYNLSAGRLLITFTVASEQDVVGNA